MIVATFIFGFLKYTKREIDLRQSIWVGYLFMISVVEEIAFRLSLPLLITSDVTGISFFWIGAPIQKKLIPVTSDVIKRGRESLKAISSTTEIMKR